LASKPGIISLGGGYPSPDSFPTEMIGDLADIVIEKYADKSLQYGPTEGFMPLREALVPLLAKRGITTEVDNVLVTTGSQGLLDTIGKIFISKGDKVAVEAPTYIGALQAFNAYEPEYIAIKTDEEGVIPEAVEDVLKNHKIKFVYLIPTFQNPTGRTIPVERRKQIAEIVKKYNALLVEDDPYGELRYWGDPVPTIKSFAPDNVLYASTISKIFAPGFRTGFCDVPASIKNWLLYVKQGVDLHTSSFNQALAAEYISRGFLDKQMEKIIGIYKPKLETMLAAMDNHFPDSFTWSKPEGGMFIWAEGPKGLDMEEIFIKAVENKVAFVAGKFFFTDPGEGIETMRLNFTSSNEEQINTAVARLGEVIKNHLETN